MTERGRRTMDDDIFEKHQRNFYRRIENNTKYEGKTPEVDKFVNVWGGIWEKDKKTPVIPWMEEAREALKAKVHEVEQFTIKEEVLSSTAKKRKTWTSPGIDGIQNYWWEKFKSAQRALRRAYDAIKEDNNMIPQWWPVGRTVLLPKSKELGDEKNYRPIACFNTSYKFLTGLMGKYMRNHAIENNIWDEGQLGGVGGVLGTVDQLLIDACIMEEVKEHHRNLAVECYDYKKAYDKVHHDWMLRVYSWKGIPVNVILLLRKLMKKWKTRLKIWSNGKKNLRKWIKILCGFFQGDSYSPVGFCLTEVPVCRLIESTRGYRMGKSGERRLKRIHSLFIDDLKVYQENHKRLEVVNEMIVQASHDTGACYGESRRAEIVFKKRKIIKGEGLPVLQERIKTIDPDDNETYKFLGVEQSDGIKKKDVVERVKIELARRLELLTKTELNDENLMTSINSKVIPVAAYTMNICRFTKAELSELDQIIKRELRDKSMLGRQSSDKRLYLRRENGGQD